MLKYTFDKINPNICFKNSSDVVKDYNLDSFDIVKVTGIKNKTCIYIGKDNILIDNHNIQENVKNVIEINYIGNL